jgi:hypothetical protein
MIISDYESIDLNNYVIHIFIENLKIFLFDELPDLRKSSVHCKADELPDLRKSSVHCSTDKVNGGISSQAFLCIILKKINFYQSSMVNESKNNRLEVKYNLKIDQGGIIDLKSTSAEWKHFAKQTHKSSLFEVNILICGNVHKINANVCPLTVNIREETLIHILSFFSNSHQIPKSNGTVDAFVEIFSMKAIGLVINYFPLIVKENMNTDMLTLKNFKLNLSSQYLKNINGFNTLISCITTNWKSDLNPNNIIQFIPNIKIIHPYTTIISRFIKLTSKYFEHGHNKKKIRYITKNINKGVSMVTSIIKLGINQVIDLFD